MLALLVCEQHRPIPRDELADNLWPVHRPPTWPTALRVVVGRVRHFLSTAGLAAPEALRAQEGTYRLTLPARVEVDVEVALADTELADQALKSGNASATQILAERACAVLERPLLADVEAPWLEFKRKDLDRARIRAIEALAESRLAVQAPDAAAAAANEALALDPFRESAHRLLLRAHQHRGNIAVGLQTYEELRSMLGRELGTAPSPQTRALHTELLRAGGPPASET